MKKLTTVFISIIAISISIKSQNAHYVQSGTLKSIIESINYVGTIDIAGTVNVNESIEVPESIELRFLVTGNLEIAENVTLTINGSVKAGLHQIFILNQNSVINGTPRVVELFPQWWGAVVNDNIDDLIPIQQAINCATSFGGTVVFSPGEYLFGGNIVVKDNVRLLGKGGILKYRMPPVNAGSFLYPINNMGYHNVILDGLIIDCDNTTNTIPTAVCDAVTLSGRNSIIKNCKIINSIDCGIMFSDASNGKCISNVIVNTNPGVNDIGIYINNNSSDNNDLNLISNNIIEGFRLGGISLKRHAQRFLISNNLIKNCGHGIVCESHPELQIPSVNDVQIVNNKLYHIGFNELSTGTGIQLVKSDYSIVSNNRIEDIESNGIRISGSSYCNIHGNIIEKVVTKTNPKGGAGIVMGLRENDAQNLYSSTNNTIQNNIINDVRIGIWLDASLYIRWYDGLGIISEISKNIISGNSISNASSIGLYITGNAHSININELNIITNNIITNSGYRGLRINQGANFTRNNISNNIFGTDPNIPNLLDAEYFYNSSNDENLIVNNTYVNNKISGFFNAATGNSSLNLNGKLISVENYPPQNGNWDIGDIVLNKSATAGDKIGWVCTAIINGDPVWKSFGQISE